MYLRGMKHQLQAFIVRLLVGVNSLVAQTDSGSWGFNDIPEGSQVNQMSGPRFDASEVGSVRESRARDGFVAIQRRICQRPAVHIHHAIWLAMGNSFCGHGRACGGPCGVGGAHWRDGERALLAVVLKPWVCAHKTGLNLQRAQTCLLQGWRLCLHWDTTTPKGLEPSHQHCACPQQTRTSQLAVGRCAQRDELFRLGSDAGNRC